MEGPSTVLIIIGLFFLRLVVPLLVVVAIGYVLTRLDARWQAEADEEAKRRRPTAETARGTAQASVSRPPNLIRSPALAATAGVPCWSIKGCTEALKATCAACRQPDRPCWAARTSAEGRLPAECKGCDLYQPTVPTYQPTVPMWIDHDVIH